ncbi:hypothetical protein CLAFUW4_04246, partial [Fulvia fulva]
MIGTAAWLKSQERTIRDSSQPAASLLGAFADISIIQWQLYPKPKLGDMGSAVETTAGEPSTNNPRAFRDVGTPGFLAPEMHLWHSSNHRGWHDKPRLNAATNIYGIGMVIYVSHYNLDQPPAPRNFPEGPLPPGAHTESVSLTILTSLMWRCLSFAPDERPSLDDIFNTFLRKSKGQLIPNDEYSAKMHKLVPKVAQPWFDGDRGAPYLLDIDFTDNYRIGLTRNNLPPS